MTADKTELHYLALLSRVLDATPDHVSVVDSDYRYCFVNKAYERAHEQSKEEIVGRDAEEYLGSDVFEKKVRPMLDRCFAGQDVSYEAWFYFKGRGRRFMSVRYMPLDIGEGKKGALVLANDITQRKLTEMALAASEEKYRRWAENAPHGIFVADQQGNYVEVNSTALSMTGYTTDELLGMSIQQLVPEHFLAEVTRGFQQLLAVGRLEQRIQLKRKDGQTFWVDLCAVRLAEDRFMGFCNDVSQHVATEEQLRHSQKMDALGQLAGGVAHDFNNILTAIMGYSIAILSESDSDSVRQGASEIVTASERAAKLTRQLLSFSRRDPGVNQSLDVQELFKGLIPMLSRLIGEKYELSWQPCPEQLLVEGDPGKLEQVLVNLVVNARDAMPEGGCVIVEMSLYNTPDAPAEVRGGSLEHRVAIEVSDHGTGMSAEVRERIFEPFFTTKPPGAGTGLGLSTVHGIVESVGGTIEIESELGAGSCFRVLLPRTTTAPTRSPDELEQLREEGGTILLVEDEPSVRMLCENILVKAGYDVWVASRPSEALRLLRGSAKDARLLLTDVIMPEMSGPRLYQRCLEFDPNLRVLYMSGFPGDEDDTSFVASNGESLLLRKPFLPMELRRIVANVLRQSVGGF